MVNQQVTEEWLTKADEDFEYAKASLEEGLAYIVTKELSFLKTHSLITLLQICE